MRPTRANGASGTRAPFPPLSLAPALRASIRVRTEPRRNGSRRFDDYGDNVWAPDLPEVWEGIYGQRLIREAGQPLSGAVWELPPGSRGVDYHFHHATEAAHGSPDIVEYPDKGEFAAGSRLPSQRGEPFLVRLPMPDAMHEP